MAHESRQEIHIHYLDFHMEKSVSTILISPCDSLGKIFITSSKDSNNCFINKNINWNSSIKCQVEMITFQMTQDTYLWWFIISQSLDG